jgi:hypothetical protein
LLKKFLGDLGLSHHDRFYGLAVRGLRRGSFTYSTSKEKFFPLKLKFLKNMKILFNLIKLPVDYYSCVPNAVYLLANKLFGHVSGHSLR